MNSYYGEDEIVRRTLYELVSEYGGTLVISCKFLSDMSGIPERTVWRSLKRLQDAGAIRRKPRPFGSVYPYVQSTGLSADYACRDFLVRDTLQRLLAESANSRVIGDALIARRAGISRQYCRRVLAELSQSGAIRRTLVKGRGFLYQEVS